MAMFLTPEMKSEVSEETLQQFLEYAQSMRCVVVGDFIKCNHRQRALLLIWWKEHKR